ncbi:transcription factor E3-like [Saccostrea cucullata]|uniref:transcription factor E3-like n=1 Tax=Saccostrea cuccullata TaxID=36930 RepID=UPI002ED51351
MLIISASGPFNFTLRQERVDALIGDVIQIDSKFNSINEGRQRGLGDWPDRWIVSSQKFVFQNHGDDGKYVNLPDSEPNIVSELQEMEVKKKDRIKKDNHNIIERRRRYHINDRIKELASLLPPSTPQSMKLHKGSILKASVEYLKDLKKDKEKLARCETRQKEMEAKYQKILIRKFQIELKMRLHGLSMELDFKRGMKNKKAKKSFDKVDEIVENLIEQKKGSAENTNDLTLPQRDKLEIPKQGQMFSVQNILPTSKMAADSLPLFSSSSELSIKQSDIFSGSARKPKYQCCSTKSFPFSSCHHLSSTEKAASTKVTSSMLETLLRKSE